MKHYTTIRDLLIKMLNEDTPYANNVKEIRSQSPYKNDHGFIAGTIAYEIGLVIYDYFQFADVDRCTKLAEDFAHKFAKDNEFLTFWKTYTNQ